MDLLPWPRFVLKPMACPESAPTVIRQALAQGIPSRGVGGEYVALAEAAFLDGSGKLLAIGESGLDGRICVDTDSQEVVQVPAPGASANPVNTDLAAFASCINAAVAAFPYYSYETVEEFGGVVARNLKEKLLLIDSRADAHNGFWETFLDDVEMGNYAIEEFEGKDIGRDVNDVPVKG